jgi:hypothetical protein
MLPICVKSEAPNRPGSWTWAKNTSCAGPAVARQRRTCRCRVRSWPSANRPGYCRCNSTNSVFASNPGLSANCASTCGQTSAKGSGRVRHACGKATSLGRRCKRRYLRAVFSSMSHLKALAASVTPSANLCHNACTCLSVTIASLLAIRACVSLRPGILIVVGHGPARS